MPKPTTTARFATTISRLEDGMRHHVLEIPKETGTAFKNAKVKRILLTLNGNQYRRAIQRKRDGRYIIVLGKNILKETNLTIGDPVEAHIEADPEPDFVDTGEELAEVLAQDAEARKRWESFSVGKQRSLAMYVTGAKTVDTRIKRALELAEKMRTYTLYGDREKD